MTGALKFSRKPEINDPYMIAAWPGIGNIGLIAVNYLKNRLEAEEFGEIEPWHYFFPKGVSVQDSVLQEMEFPANKFYYKKAQRDLIIFLGEMQPAGEEEIYEIANHVLDVAEEFGCKRVYTAGAAVAPVHHTSAPKVWAVPNKVELVDEARGYINTIVMSEIGEREGRGSITGLNGVLIGVAKKRNLDGICLLGEIPIYIAHFPGHSILYPKASKSILEVLSTSLKVEVDLVNIEVYAKNVEMEIDFLYESLPLPIRMELDKLKHVSYVRQNDPGPITEEEKEKIIKEVEEFFREGREHG